MVSFVGMWQLISNGYDKQNKVILLLKKIIPSNIARKVSTTVFYIPNLKNRNKFLEMQLAKYDQGLKGEKFFEKKEKTADNKYNYSLKNFYLPFPSLDLNLAWNTNKNQLRAHYFEIIDNYIFVMSGEGETVYFDRKNINNDNLNLKRIGNNLREVLDQKNVTLSAIRDIYYEKNFIYVSILESTKDKSFFNIYRAEKNLQNLDFKIFF